MKQFSKFIVTFLVLIVSAQADACGAKYTGIFTAAAATQLCKEIGNPYETLAGAGTAQGDATAVSVTKRTHRLTGANGTVGWRLPAVSAANVGEQHTFLNTTAGVANLYPATGGTINGAAANAVFAALTGIKPIVCIVTAASTWICS